MITYLQVKELPFVKLVLHCSLFLVLFFSFHTALAQFPYSESFKNSTAQGIQFGGEPNKAYLTAGINDPEGNGYLRLTDNSTDQKGYIYSQSTFPSRYGLKVELEYYTYGGYGGVGGSGADGITFFLFDASANPFQIGAFGGSLGYSQKNTPATPNSPGVSKGYLGIGLDEYGNFSNDGEGRLTGKDHYPILRPGSVTLRGKGDGYSDNISNYAYLTSVQTDSLPVGSRFKLTPRDGSRHFSTTDAGYRKVFIDLKPSAVKGYDITVRITVGGSTPTTYTVINNYHYNEDAPAALRYGIASSTGLYTNIHEIRNVAIDLYDHSLLQAPIAKSDTAESCFLNPVTINVTSNDQSLNNNGTLVLSSIDLDPATTAIDHSVTIPGQGTFNANNDGTVIFTPLNGNVTGPVTASYTIVDNYGETSSPAAITVNSAPRLTADAGPDQTITINSATGAATLAAVLPAAATGSWTQISGSSATITNPTATNTTVTGMVPGTYTFLWTVSSATSCPNSDAVQIIVINPALPVAVDDRETTTPARAITIDVLTNDVFNTSGADWSTLSIVSGPAHGTAAVNRETGTVKYTPDTAYSGTDNFTYFVKNLNGTASNTARVIIDIKPAGSNDTRVTTVNTPVVVPVKENDVSKNGTTIIAVTAPLHGSISVNAGGTITYTPALDYNGTDVFTYQLKTADGLQSDPISVSVIVNILPVANNDTAPPTDGGPVEIDVTGNDTDEDGNIIKGTVIITTPPQHGTVTVDPLTGKVIYTPDPGYSGPDTFSYVVRDDKGSESEPGNVTIQVSLPPKIGLAKALTSSNQAINGTYDVTFTFTIKNYGNNTLSNISLRDDLADAFSGTEVTVKGVKTVSSSLTTNPAFNGINDTGLLKPSGSSLAPSESALVVLELNIKLVSREGSFSNTAEAEGYTPGNKSVSDQSTSGLSPDPGAAGDVSHSEPTTVVLNAPTIFIPQGFSPNQDGINDLFVIQNKINKKINLEIFNRWGNRVYRSADYQNDWGGRCTEGIHVGEEVPAGTYYYIISIDNTNKYVGYITINR